MRTSFKSIVDILTYFKDETTCLRLLEQQRFGSTVCCIHCGNAKVYRTNRGFRCADITCAKKFSAKVGTIFENSKIPLRIWFAAIYIATAHKRGISSHQLARDLGITQKTAWFVLQRIREMLKENAPVLLQDVVEIDETYVGGKRANKHAKKREEMERIYGPGYKEKTPVVGLLQRGGKVFCRSVAVADGIRLKPIVRDLVKAGSTIMTDGHGAYAGLSYDYHHEVINHAQGEYKRDTFHTNTIEGYWGLLKRGIIGTYYHVSPKHLDRYCNEFSYRYNTRDIKDADRFIGVLTRVEIRLKYKDLIGKV